MTTRKPDIVGEPHSSGIKSVSKSAELHKCPTHFVPDLPALSDSFETNKAYKRVVSAIVEIVRSPTNNTSLSIGVEGSLGAGKTTLINLVREALGSVQDDSQNEENVTIRLIAFDAWAHEGDPLRLTFLETLVDDLSGVWVDRDKWTEQLEIVGRRKEVRDIASDFGLTWFDGVIAFSFFLIPIGVAVLTAALRSEITLDRTRPVAWGFLTGLLLCIAAPTLVMGKVVWQKIQNYLARQRSHLQPEPGYRTRQAAAIG